MRPQFQKYIFTLAASALAVCAVSLSLTWLPAAHAGTNSLSAVDLQNIATAGGSMQFDASRFSAVDLQNIATSASNASPQPANLILLNADKFSAVDLQNIATAGKGHVTFILDR